MSEKMYFQANVNGAGGLFRLDENESVARVDLPDGVDGNLELVAGGDTPIFIVRGATENTLVQLEASGVVSLLTDSAGDPILIDNVEQIVADGGDVYFSGVQGGEEAIWRRAADGTVEKLTDALTPGKVFEFNAGRLWINATSTLDSPDGDAHAALFAISSTGQIERMTELRTVVVFEDDFGDEFLVPADAVISSGFAAGGNIFYSYNKAFDTVLSTAERTDDVVFPDGSTQTLVGSLNNRSAVVGSEIYTTISNDNSKIIGLQIRDATTGDTVRSLEFRTEEFASISSPLFFEGKPHMILAGDIVKVNGNGSITRLVDGNANPSQEGGVGLIKALSAFGGVLYFETEIFGAEDVGREIYKLENGVVSLVINLTAGAGSISISAPLGVFDTGDEGGTPIFSSNDPIGTDGDDVLEGTSADNVLSGLAGNDILRGFAGDDELNGNSGDDELIGGTGGDQMTGGTGDDTYEVDDIGDLVIENAGEGTDLVRTSLSYTLPDNVENLLITPPANPGSLAEAQRTGTGNELDNVLTGAQFGQTLLGLGGDDVIDGKEGGDTLFGGDGDDTLIGGEDASRDKLVGGNGNDDLDGGAGDDRLFGNAGDDIINGGDGEDIIMGQSGNDVIDGGAGEDVINGGFGNDEIDGGAGEDVIDGSFGADVIRGGDARDKLIGGGGVDTLNGEGGNDRIYGGAQGDIMNGGEGDDLLVGQSGDDDMTGGAGGDEFFLTTNGGDNVIQDFEAGFLSSDFVNASRLGFASGLAAVSALTENGSGNAVLSYSGGSVTFTGLGKADFKATDFFVSAPGPVGTRGNDTIRGGAGNDRLVGNAGDDDMAGGDGNDGVFGGTGDDLIVGDDGNDSLFGGDGEDRIIGGRGNDLIRGGAGDDEAFGNGGDDRMIGEDGDDFLFGQSGADIMAGANGVDTLRGGFGNDQLFGNQGDDVLFGDEGDDRLTGGAGDDRFTGGAGFDQFVAGSGLDVITDFDGGAGAGDVLILTGLGFADFDAVIAATINNAFGALIQVGAGDSISLLGVAAGSLVEDDIII